MIFIFLKVVTLKRVTTFNGHDACFLGVMRMPILMEGRDISNCGKVFGEYRPMVLMIIIIAMVVIVGILFSKSGFFDRCRRS